MTPAEAMQIGLDFAYKTGWEAPSRYGRNFAVPTSTFTPLSQAAADWVRWGLSEEQRAAIPWLKEWVEVWARLRGDFIREHELDPMISYVPLADVHRRFHASTAYIRLFAAGNGTSKSSAGFHEDYLAATGQLHWKHNRGDVCVVGVADKSWGTQVFKPKFLEGEKNNFFSPIFPDGGRWFKRFDRPKNYIELACPDCSAKNRPKFCRHDGSKVYAASSETGWEAIQGGSFVLGHIDEHAKDVEIFRELLQRTRRGDTRGRIIVTATPLFGNDAWEKKILWGRWQGDPELNWQNKTKGERWVEIFTCSKYEAGLVPVEEIEAERREMPPSVFAARVMGEPVSIAEMAVFDLQRLDLMKSYQVSEPDRTKKVVIAEEGVSLKEIDFRNEVKLVDDESTNPPLRIWRQPREGATYILSADPAGGLSHKGDPSAAYVFEIFPGVDPPVPRLRVVAAWHDWANPFDFGEECKKLALYYNEAIIIPETTGGHGRALVLMLTRELDYQNIHQDDTQPQMTQLNVQERYGVDTNPSTKGTMIGALQRYINKGLIIIPDEDAYREMFSYEETRTDLGNSRYGGAQGEHDDRVMALAIACYACASSGDTFLFGDKFNG